MKPKDTANGVNECLAVDSPGAAGGSPLPSRHFAPFPTPEGTRFMSLEDAAEVLGLHRAEVMELVRSGELPAKRVGSSTLVTAANLAAFVADCDRPASFPRYEQGDVVVYLTEDDEIGRGRFAHENDDGTVRVLRSGFLGTFETTFPAEQVQPFVCRLPYERSH